MARPNAMVASSSGPARPVYLRIYPDAFLAGTSIFEVFAPANGAKAIGVDSLERFRQDRGCTLLSLAPAITGRRTIQHSQ